MSATYRRAVEWIALNDEPTCTDAGALAEMISVMLVADVFRRMPEKVARDVLARRKEEEGVACPRCKGLKTMAYTVVEGNTERALSMKCIDCNGEGRVSAKRAVEIEQTARAIAEMWCRCKESTGSHYVPDAPGVKHHWCCDACGKVTQVG